MKDSNSKESTATVSDLVLALNELRDSLLNASLAMQELLFESDSSLRSEAVKCSTELIRRTRVHK
jgi:hypothetical protein